MIRNLLISALLFLPLAVFSQTQQKGVVKTKGRMVNGQHVKGQALTGAVVTLKGQNAVAVRNADAAWEGIVQIIMATHYFVNSINNCVL